MRRQLFSLLGKTKIHHRVGVQGCRTPYLVTPTDKLIELVGSSHFCNFFRIVERLDKISGNKVIELFSFNSSMTCDFASIIAFTVDQRSKGCVHNLNRVLITLTGRMS